MYMCVYVRVSEDPCQCPLYVHVCVRVSEDPCQGRSYVHAYVCTCEQESIHPAPPSSFFHSPKTEERHTHLQLGRLQRLAPHQHHAVFCLDPHQRPPVPDGLRGDRCNVR